MLSVTKKDLVIETMRGSGKGGQHRNKRDTAVRITHPESGAVGTAQDSKSQAQNKKLAFRRMANSWEFRRWVYWMTKQFLPGEVKVEVYRNGRWENE